MYESMSYEKILQRMLDRVSDQMDKREGSIIYDALAPAAMEMMLMYLELEHILQETFGDTASREYLIRRAAERGIAPYPATFAILKGEFNREIEIGSRFSCADLNYTAIQQIEGHTYQLRCESLGTIGNKHFGTLIPIDYIEGLTTAQLTELLIPGEDEEETESIRSRYFASFKAQAYGGNVADYLAKTNAISGVGATKVTPIWNGGGTVKLTVLDAEYNRASSALIETVQQKIDPTRDGMGVGIAPIGHVVTVDTVSEVQVQIETSITFEEGSSFEGKKQEILKTLQEYLLEIRKAWAQQTAPTVRIAQIESRVMAIKGVVDISGTKINQKAENLILSNDQIPIMGGIINASTG